MEKPLPFENASFNTIFSNVFYWITDLRQLLSECHRILKNTGRLIVAVPDKKFQKNLIYSEYLKHGHQWAKYLDRGNHKNLKHFHTYAEWKSIFSSAGFKIEYHSSYLSEMFVRWSQIGNWMYTPTMTKMSNLIDPQIRNTIKSKLIENVLPIVMSYVNYEMTLRQGTFHLFILRPNSK